MFQGKITKKEELETLNSYMVRYDINFYQFYVKTFMNNLQSGELDQSQAELIWEVYSVLNDTIFRKNSINNMLFLDNPEHVDSLVEIGGKTFLVLNRGLFQISLNFKNAVKLMQLVSIRSNEPLYNTAVEKEVRASKTNKRYSDQKIKQLFKDQEFRNTVSKYSTLRQTSKLMGQFESNKEMKQTLRQFLSCVDSSNYKPPHIDSNTQDKSDVMEKLMALYYFQKPYMSNKFEYVNQQLGNCYNNCFIQPILIAMFLNHSNSIDNFLSGIFYTYQAFQQIFYVVPRFLIYEIFNQDTYRKLQRALGFSQREEIYLQPILSCSDPIQIVSWIQETDIFVQLKKIQVLVSIDFNLIVQKIVATNDVLNKFKQQYLNFSQYFNEFQNLAHYDMIATAQSHLKTINVLNQTDLFPEVSVNKLHAGLPQRSLEKIPFTDICTHKHPQERNILFMEVNIIQEHDLTVFKDLEEIGLCYNKYFSTIEQCVQEAKAQSALQAKAQQPPEFGQGDYYHYELELNMNLTNFELKGFAQSSFIHCNYGGQYPDHMKYFAGVINTIKQELLMVSYISKLKLVNLYNHWKDACADPEQFSQFVTEFQAEIKIDSLLIALGLWTPEYQKLDSQIRENFAKNQDQDQDQDQGQDQEQDQEQDQGQYQGQGQEQDQDQDQEQGQGQYQGQDQGQDQDQDQEQGQGQYQGQDQGQDQDQDQEQGQGQYQGQDQGQDQTKLNNLYFVYGRIVFLLREGRILFSKNILLDCLKSLNQAVTDAKGQKVMEPNVAERKLVYWSKDKTLLTFVADDQNSPTYDILNFLVMNSQMMEDFLDFHYTWKKEDMKCQFSRDMTVVLSSEKGNEIDSVRTIFWLRPVATILYNMDSFFCPQLGEGIVIDATQQAFICEYLFNLQYVNRECKTASKFFYNNSFKPRFYLKPHRFLMTYLPYCAARLPSSSSSGDFSMYAQNRFQPLVFTQAETIPNIVNQMKLNYLHLTSKDIQRIMWGDYPLGDEQVNIPVYVNIQKKQKTEYGNVDMKLLDDLKLQVISGNNEKAKQTLVNLVNFDLIVKKNIPSHCTELVNLLPLIEDPGLGRCFVFILYHFYQLGDAQANQYQDKMLSFYYRKNYMTIPNKLFLISQRLIWLNEKEVTNLFYLFLVESRMVSLNEEAMLHFEVDSKAAGAKKLDKRRNYIPLKEYTCFDLPIEVDHFGSASQHHHGAIYYPDQTLQEFMGQKLQFHPSELKAFQQNTSSKDYAFMHFLFNNVALDVVKKNKDELLLISPLWRSGIEKRITSFRIERLKDGNKIFRIDTLEQYAMLFYHAVQLKLTNLIYFITCFTACPYSFVDLRSTLKQHDAQLDNWAAEEIFLDWQNINTNFVEFLNYTHAMYKKEMNKILNYFIAMGVTIDKFRQYPKNDYLQFTEDITVHENQTKLVQRLYESYAYQSGTDMTPKKNSFQIRTGMGKTAIIAPLLAYRILFENVNKQNPSAPNRPRDSMIFITYQENNRQQMERTFVEVFSSLQKNPITIVSGGFNQVQRTLLLNEEYWRAQQILKEIIGVKLKTLRASKAIKVTQANQTICIFDYQEFLMNLDKYVSEKGTESVVNYSPICIDEIDSMFDETEQSRKEQVPKNQDPNKVTIDLGVVNQNAEKLAKEFQRILTILNQSSQDQDQTQGQDKDKNNLVMQLMKNFANLDPNIQMGPYSFRDFEKFCGQINAQDVSNFLDVRPRVSGAIQCFDDYKNFISKLIFNLFYYSIFQSIPAQNFSMNEDLLNENQVKGILSALKLGYHADKLSLIKKVVVNTDSQFCIDFSNADVRTKMIQKLFVDMIQKVTENEYRYIEKNCYDFFNFVNSTSKPVIAFSGTDFSVQKQLELNSLLEEFGYMSPQKILFIDSYEGYQYDPKKFYAKEQEELQRQLEEDYTFNTFVNTIRSSKFNHNGQFLYAEIPSLLKQILSYKKKKQSFVQAMNVDFLIDPNGVLFNMPTKEVIETIRKLNMYQIVCSAEEFASNFMSFQENTPTLVYFPVGYGIGFDVRGQKKVVQNIFLITKTSEDNSNQTTQKMFWQAISRARYSNYGIQTHVFINHKFYTKPYTKIYEQVNYEKGEAVQEAGLTNFQVKQRIAPKIKYFILPDTVNDAVDYILKKFQVKLELQECTQIPEDLEGNVFDLAAYQQLINEKLLENQNKFLENPNFNVLAAKALFHDKHYQVKPINYIDEKYIFTPIKSMEVISQSELLQHQILDNNIFKSKYENVVVKVSKRDKERLDKLLKNNFFSKELPLNLTQMSTLQQQQQDKEQAQAMQMNRLRKDILSVYQGKKTDFFATLSADQSNFLAQIINAQSPPLSQQEIQEIQKNTAVNMQYLKDIARALKQQTDTSMREFMKIPAKLLRQQPKQQKEVPEQQKKQLVMESYLRNSANLGSYTYQYSGEMHKPRVSSRSWSSSMRGIPVLLVIGFIAYARWGDLL